MSRYCPECGCHTNDGVCSNCQEELFILLEQADEIDAVSKEFMDKATEQRKILLMNKRFPWQHPQS